MEKLVFYKLEVKRELWEKFKETITKNQTINNVLLDLIKERIEKFEKPSNLKTKKS